MYARIQSGATYGVDGIVIDIECHIEGQLPSFTIVGLPDNAVKESRERVTSAIKNSGFPLPPKKITVNLAPADLKKEGSAFDLPIALGILEALNVITVPRGVICLGELSLNGELRPIRGALPIAIKAQEEHFKQIFVPENNAKEASVIQSLDVYGISSLKEMVSFFKGEITLVPTNYAPSKDTYNHHHHFDFADVKGQTHVKRALEIAAAGHHNVILIGPPGSGKTMLSKRIPGILPELTLNESLETTKLFSISGHLHKEGLVENRPFRSPHHTISDVALIGGGRGLPRPGEVSLAHHGVLFLDELPEFKKSVLEVMRQPLEDGIVTIARANASLTFPSQFMLVAAMNPCPCGFSTDPKRECSCTMHDIQRYLNKVSGPLLDRIDIHVDVPPVDVAHLADFKKGESSSDIRRRVVRARNIQSERFNEHTPTHTNAGMNSNEIERFCSLDPTSQKLLHTAMEKLGLSARAFNRILKVSRTIADLDGADSICSHHVAEAIQFRSLDKQFGF